MSGEFWIIWSPQGETPPRNRHYAHDDALRVCEQMSRSHPGALFYAMKTVAVAFTPKAETKLAVCNASGRFVDHHGCETDDEIPF